MFTWQFVCSDGENRQTGREEGRRVPGSGRRDPRSSMRCRSIALKIPRRHLLTMKDVGFGDEAVAHDGQSQFHARNATCGTAVFWRSVQRVASAKFLSNVNAFRSTCFDCLNVSVLLLSLE